jgi:hypothetical protein
LAVHVWIYFWVSILSMCLCFCHYHGVLITMAM